MKYKASENLRKQLEADIKFNKGKKGSFVQKVEAVLKKEFRDQYDAENYANELGLSRTMFMGGMGFIR